MQGLRCASATLPGKRVGSNRGIASDGGERHSLGYGPAKGPL
jgi:hypothetical protein